MAVEEVYETAKGFQIERSVISGAARSLGKFFRRILFSEGRWERGILSPTGLYTIPLLEGFI
jgi:hypothetical protein